MMFYQQAANERKCPGKIQGKCFNYFETFSKMVDRKPFKKSKMWYNRGVFMQFQERKMEKSMKKRILACIVAACTVLSLVGCGGEIKNDKIKITQYKGLEVDKVESAEVTDEDVEASIQSTLYTLSTTNEITDRPAQEGDEVTIDYAGKVDGVAFDGGTAEDQTITIGEGKFIDGFEEQIIGHNIGETFDINVTFPEGYSEELGGKDAVFTITLDKIVERIIPELTEELLPQLSTTATTLDGYRAEVKKDLETSNAESAKSELEQLIWNSLIENCVIETYPEDKMKEVTSNIESQFTYMASYYGMEVSALIENYYGITLEEMAQNLIKQEFAVELIAEKEKLTLTAADYDKGLADYAEQYGYDDVEEFEEMVGKEELQKTLLQKRVGEFLMENCKQVEKESK